MRQYTQKTQLTTHQQSFSGSGNHPQNNHFDLDHSYMRKLAIFDLFEYIQYGHKVKIIDSNMVANTGAQKKWANSHFRSNLGTLVAGL